MVEDTQTSYWTKFEGSTKEMNTIPIAINYFMDKVHHVNKAEWIKEDTQKEIPTDEIASVSFYHNLIFVVKKSSE